jgi:hypothetical protein
VFLVVLETGQRAERGIQRRTGERPRVLQAVTSHQRKDGDGDQGPLLEGVVSQCVKQTNSLSLEQPNTTTKLLSKVDCVLSITGCGGLCGALVRVQQGARRAFLRLI